MFDGKQIYDLRNKIGETERFGPQLLCNTTACEQNNGASHLNIRAFCGKSTKFGTLFPKSTVATRKKKIYIMVFSMYLSF